MHSRVREVESLEEETMTQWFTQEKPIEEIK
jgi:hypothetical protein